MIDSQAVSGMVMHYYCYYPENHQFGGALLSNICSQPAFNFPADSFMKISDDMYGRQQMSMANNPASLSAQMVPPSDFKPSIYQTDSASTHAELQPLNYLTDHGQLPKEKRWTAKEHKYVQGEKYSEVKVSLKSPPANHPLNSIAWNPPQNDTIKLNFDGGYSRQLKRGISAGIFRDRNGMPLFSFTQYHGCSPYDGESGGLLYGLLFAQKLGYKKLWVEGDAQYLIHSIVGTRANQCYSNDDVKAIRKTLEEFEETPKITFMYREANEAADALVKLMHNRCIMTRQTWIGMDLPSHIHDIIYREKQGCSYTRKTF